MIRKRFFRLFVFLLLILLSYQAAAAAVDLVDFSATPLSASILIEWETATEIDNAGFFVKRSTNPALPYEDVSGFIPSEGSGVIGAEYQFEDENVSVGVLYFYILEAIDNGQNVETHGPITAVIGEQEDTPTPTASATSTKTKKPQGSATATRTSTPSRTPRPSRTPTPVPPSLTPTFFTHTPTVTSSPTITPTATLDAPPAIVLTFPASNTPEFTKTVTPFPSWTPTPEPDGALGRFIDSGYPLLLGSICFVALVWAAIAVGIFIFLQYRNS